MHLQQNHLRILEVRMWLLAATGALAVAGLLALALALARTPGLQDLFPTGPGFFRKALVTHVVFSFQVWLLCLLAAACAQSDRVAPVPGLVGGALVLAGSMILLVLTVAGWGEASLNNYVPVLDHPAYLVGLVLVAVGIGCAVLRPGTGLGGVGVAYAVALLAFVQAGLRLPVLDGGRQTYETLFWGGGHILQFVNTGLVMWAWLRLSGVPADGLARLAFWGLAAGACCGQIIEAGADFAGPGWRQGYTALFWYLLPWPPLLVGVHILRQRSRVSWHSVAGLALACSWLVFALGGVAGFALGQDDTRTPSHYHAMIGGLNVALMGVIHVVLLPALGRAGVGHKAPVWQIGLYGGGQLLHALGFYLAGMAGVARKTAGTAQGLDSAFKMAAMGLVGLGAAIAVLGGVLFVVHVLGRLLSRPHGPGGILPAPGAMPVPGPGDGHGPA